MNKSPAVPIAQGTPMLINRLHMLADALDLHDAYMIERDDSAQVRLAAAELAALSAQVVELQKERARDRVTHDLDLQGKMLEAAKAQVAELQNTIRNARVQREAAEAHVEALQKEVAEWKRYKQGIDEALNTGDGSYQP